MKMYAASLFGISVIALFSCNDISHTSSWTKHKGDGEDFFETCDSAIKFAETFQTAYTGFVKSRVQEKFFSLLELNPKELGVYICMSADRGTLIYPYRA